MKKLITLSLVLILTLSLAASAFAEESIVDNMSDTPYDFSSIMGSQKWSEMTSFSERTEALQIPENRLNTMSTAALIETVLNYPYILEYIYLAESYDYARDYFEKIFNGFDELLSRENLTEQLLNKYETLNLGLPKLVSDDGKLIATEFLILCDIMYNGDYTNSEYERVKGVADNISELITNKDIDSLFATLSFDNSSDTMRYEEPGDGSGPFVYTPCGKVVSVSRRAEDTNAVSYANSYFSQGHSMFPLDDNGDGVEDNPGTNLYNCHSYAWYSQSSSNPFWMENPSAYMDGDCYKKTTLSKLMAGDRVYWNDSNLGTHSAIVYYVGSDTVYVVSKFGASKVFLHAINDHAYANGTVSYWTPV